MKDFKYYNINNNKFIKTKLSDKLYTSEKGRVFNIKTLDFVDNEYNDADSYRYVQFRDKLIAAHIIVANTYIENPNNYKFIKHIDGNPHNNSINNLEWVENESLVQKSMQCFEDIECDFPISNMLFTNIGEAALHLGVTTDEIRSAIYKAIRIGKVYINWADYKEDLIENWRNYNPLSEKY